MKKSSWLITVCVILFTGYHIVTAGTTGKISGFVKDAETNEPLPAANIIIESTERGAASNSNGIYTILNIPPGTYIVRAKMMGYKDKIIKNVKVSIDLTTQVNIDMQQTTIQGEEVVKVAERPIVQPDMTSSLSTVATEDIQDLPVQEISQVLTLQAGIVNADGLHIRGGRRGEVAHWVDGVPVTNASGNRGVVIENSMVQELQVVSGTFNAEYGNAMSGIVNYVTKEGGNQYSGRLRSYVDTYYSTSDVYSVLNTVETVTDEVTGETQARAEKDYPLQDIRPSYNVDGTLSGPIPGIDKMNFFANIRYRNEKGWRYGREWFLPQGVPGDSSLVPLSPFERLSSFAKLTYRFNPDIKLTFSLFWNRDFHERGVGTNLHNNKYIPGSGRESHIEGFTNMLSLVHNLSPTTFYELRLSRYSSKYESYKYKDWNKTPGYLAMDTGSNTTYDPHDPANEEIIQRLKENDTLKWVVDPEDPEGYIDPTLNSSENIAPYSFNKLWMDHSHISNSDQYWLAKLDVTSQITPSHQIKTGIEARLSEFDRYRFNLKPKLDSSGVKIVPYEPTIPEPSSTDYYDYMRKPKQFSAYVQDKMEFGEIIVNAGLRFDYFDANSVTPADPEDPDIYHPWKNEHKYSGWVDPPDDLTDSELQAYIDQYEGNEYTPEERREFMHKESSPKSQLSPRLGMAYPITDRGVIHFSYGHFFQYPEINRLYSSPDFKIGKNTVALIGNADLNAERTVQYEVGLQQQLTDNIGVDVTLFYKDIRDWVGVSIPIKTASPILEYHRYENKDYANVRGVTVMLDKRYSYNFRASLDYSFMVAEGTYTNPNDGYSAILGNEEPRVVLIPLGYDRRHTANGTLTLNKWSWNISLIGRLTTGLPYTPTVGLAETSGTSAYRGWKENSERRPTLTWLDLRLERRLSFLGLKHSLFVYVYNLFDQKGATNVYSDTGLPNYTTNPDPNRIDYHPDRIGTVEHLVNRPVFYQSPRRIQLGYAIDF